MKIVKFYNYGYGEYACSKCSTPLVGNHLCIGKEDDIDGYYWRGFCKNCESKLNNLTNEEIYRKYKETALINDSAVHDSTFNQDLLEVIEINIGLSQKGNDIAEEILYFLQMKYGDEFDNIMKELS